MGFCIGGKACRRLDCKERCKSWFALQPELEKACKNACKSNSSLEQQDFLCSGKYVSEQVIMLAYGYDPCAGGVTMDDVLDPTGSMEYEAEKLDKLGNTFILLGALIAVGLAVLYFMRK